MLAVCAILTLAPSARCHVASKKQEAGMHHHGSQLVRPCRNKIERPQKEFPECG